MTPFKFNPTALHLFEPAHVSGTKPAPAGGQQGVLLYAARSTRSGRYVFHRGGSPALSGQASYTQVLQEMRSANLEFFRYEGDDAYREFLAAQMEALLDKNSALHALAQQEHKRFEEQVLRLEKLLAPVMPGFAGSFLSLGHNGWYMRASKPARDVCVWPFWQLPGTVCMELKLEDALLESVIPVLHQWLRQEQLHLVPLTGR